MLQEVGIRPVCPKHILAASSRRPALSPAGRGISRGSDTTAIAPGQPKAAVPTLASILPALQIGSSRRCLLHMLHHVREVVLTDPRRRIDIASVAVRLAHAEIETTAIIRVG